MSARLQASRRLGALLGVALVGTAIVLGLGLAALFGAVAALVYAPIVVALLVGGGLYGRRLLKAPALPAGRTCTCCTTSQHDPVKVL